MVGTEVSAKFKGAFCEAKIKKCALALKCKITLKSSGTALTVSYEQLRTAHNTPITSYNDLKPGSTVYVSKEVVSAANSSSAGASSHTSKQSAAAAAAAAAALAAASNDPMQPATLNKVIDQSVYTVVFNDGDEKTLKRSFIRFKVSTSSPRVFKIFRNQTEFDF